MSHVTLPYLLFTASLMCLLLSLGVSAKAAIKFSFSVGNIFLLLLLLYLVLNPLSIHQSIIQSISSFIYFIISSILPSIHPSYIFKLTIHASANL